MRSDRPTSIIKTFSRTLVWFEISVWDFIRQFEGLNDGESIWNAAIGSLPKYDVLNCYIVIDGKIRYRARIAGFECGGERTFIDGRTCSARNWMLLCAPVEKAPRDIPMRGFQGFRYTEELW